MLTWRALQATFVDDPQEHWEMLARSGFDCPFEVFTQLFHEQLGREAVPAVTADIDWSQVRWSLEDLSGEELRQVHIARRFEHAVDEAYAATLRRGITDARPAVIEAWRGEQTWMVPPVLLTDAVSGGPYRYALLVGNTRLGNLLGLLARNDIPADRLHRVWMGRPLVLDQLS